MIMLRKDRDIETMGRENFLQFFSSSKPRSFIHEDMFPWHSHLHTLATISPQPVCYLIFPSPSGFLFFPSPAPSFSFLISLPPFLPPFFSYFQKSLSPCFPPDTMSFSLDSPKVNLYLGPDRC